MVGGSVCFVLPLQTFSTTKLILNGEPTVRRQVN